MHRVRTGVVTSLALAAATLSCSPGMNPGPVAAAAEPDSSGDTFAVRPAEGLEIWLRPIVGRYTVSAAAPPTGAFQTTPPAGADQVIRVSMDDRVVVNGARFSPENPDDELKVVVEWGDGQRSASGCGPCSNFNVSCFGTPTTSFQASVNLSTLNAGFVYFRTSATGPGPGDTADFLLPGCPTGGRWAP